MKKTTVTKSRLMHWVIVISIVSIIAIAAAYQKIMYLSADPLSENDCPPLFPQDDLLKRNSLIQSTKNTLPWLQKGGYINDASCLDKTAVYGIVRVKNEDDVRNALQFAKENGLKVSIAGVRHSMGGHAFARNAVVLDMRQFNQMSLDKEQKILTVQTGATWHDIQNYLHPHYAVKAMQSTDIFTVGGSISVNAHGMDHAAGSVGQTLRSMRVMLPDGTVHRITKMENADLFRHIVGGYGLFGIVLEAEIEVTENEIYDHAQSIISYQDFPEAFKRISEDKSYGLFYAHLSTAPSSLLKEMILYTYKKSSEKPRDIPPLTEVQGVKVQRFVLNISKYGFLPREIKWLAEKYIEPKLMACTLNRNQAQKSGEACLVSRNEPMHDSVPYLRNNLKNDTDILHEYFISRDQFISYIDAIRDVFQRNNTSLLNASVRVVHKEDIALNYAPEDMFSIVLYINQRTDSNGNEQMKKLTQELIAITQMHGGRFFLPYQLHYTSEQLHTAYPEIDTFFDKKSKYDPGSLLTNTWYEKYKQTAKE
jgi:FAD/FMN-containing dehydrogenase